ncbi:hypothetical protein N665_0043s0050 [Sinapis alba]|nr:hypothetical protein N665_0043s0050 [Sinapis alba]
MVLVINAIDRFSCLVNLQATEVRQRAHLQDLIHSSIVFFFLRKGTIQELCKFLELAMSIRLHFIIPQKQNMLRIFQASFPVTEDMIPNRDQQANSTAERLEHRLKNASVFFFIQTPANDMPT